MANEKTVSVQVTMDDGRKVDFPGKRRMQKESIEGHDGKLQVRLDFINGETRIFTIPHSLLVKFALHGAEQKLGDEISGVADIDDAILAVDDLIDRLHEGKWSIERETTGIAGSSVLARALVELTGKSPLDVRAQLKSLSQQEKVALRSHPKLVPIVERLEANKKSKDKGPGIDTEAVLAQFE